MQGAQLITQRNNYQPFWMRFVHLSHKDGWRKKQKKINIWLAFRFFLCLAKFTTMNRQKKRVHASHILSKTQSKWIESRPNSITNTEFICMCFFFQEMKRSKKKHIPIQVFFWHLHCCPFNFAIWLVIVGLCLICFRYGIKWDERWRWIRCVRRFYEYRSISTNLSSFESHETPQ